MEQERIPLLVVCGPTASGKTGLAVGLAKRFGGEVVSADSMQVYRHMNIGTAKPTREEMEGIPHHLLDFLEPGRTFSVAEYAELARGKVAEIHARGRLPIVAGGTGLYIQALVDHIQFEEIRSDGSLREELREQAERLGNQGMWEELRKVDPLLAERLHPNNLGRILRGLEVHRLTGVPLSAHQERSRREPGNYRLHMLGIAYEDREELYRRIGRRVDLMLEQGLVEEARRLREMGFSATASQAIGYKELEPYLERRMGLEEAAEGLKQQTRRYAKRQMTWFRRDPRIRWLYADKLGGAAELEQAAAEQMLAEGFPGAAGQR